MQFIAQQLNALRENVRSFERKYDRKENSVTILAVSKTHSVEAIRDAWSCGQRDFGENYQQEASLKVEALGTADVTWHFIGPVQGNKTRAIARDFAWLHSLERPKIARRLSELRPPGLPDLNVCIQINISGETGKSGITPAELLPLAAQIVDLPRLRLRGLMALPAPTADFTAQRDSFRRVRRCLEQLLAAGYPLDTLSMGTSHDLEAAIAEGATIVRIGTAIFGPRE